MRLLMALLVACLLAGCQTETTVRPVKPALPKSSNPLHQPPRIESRSPLQPSEPIRQTQPPPDGGNKPKSSTGR